MRALLGILPVVCGFAATAQVTGIDSFIVQERRFNDFAGTTLVVNNSFPSLQFTETGFPGSGGFANQHVGWFGTSGGTQRAAFANQGAFDISVTINLDPVHDGPRKEAGFRFDTLIGGEGFFRLTSDGEVAAFGAFFPFFTFGNDAYQTGTDAVLRMIYRPDDDADPFDGDAATIEYIFNGMSSGRLAVANAENGFFGPESTGFAAQGGFFIQASPNAAGDDGYTVSFNNAVFLVPAPGAAACLGAAGLLASRRRR